jgi:hypothetical protein
VWYEDEDTVSTRLELELAMKIEEDEDTASTRLELELAICMRITLFDDNY